MPAPVPESELGSGNPWIVALRATGYFIERVGLMAAIAFAIGGVYLGYIPSPMLSKLEAHATAYSAQSDEQLRLMRLQCQAMAVLAAQDPTPCFTTDEPRLRQLPAPIARPFVPQRLPSIPDPDPRYREPRAPARGSSPPISREPTG